MKSIENNFYLIWINLISIILMIGIVILWVNYRRKIHLPILFDLVFFILLVKTLLYFLMPATLRLISDWALDREIGVNPVEIAAVYTLEFFSIIIWMLSVVLILRLIQPKKINYIKNNEIYDLSYIKNINSFVVISKYQERKLNNKKLKKQTSILFLIILCLFYIWNFPFTIQAMSIETETERNLFIHSINIAGPLVGAYLFATGKKFGYFAFVLGLIVTVIAIIYGIVVGSRGQIITISIWLIFLYLFINKKNYIIYLAVLGLAVLFVAHSVMTTIRTDSDAKDRSFIDKLSNVVESSLKNESDTNGFINALEFRFGISSRMSVGFLRLNEIGRGAGFQPIESAFYAPIPRRFFPNKPELGSDDGTLSGLGMFRINQVVAGGESTNMSEFFTGLHAYWELGIFGVMFLSAISGLFIALFIFYFTKFGVASLPIMMVMMKPPWLEPKLWIAELIGYTFNTMLPIILIWYITYVIVIAFSGLKNGLFLSMKKKIK
jgi:hypothetical protein